MACARGGTAVSAVALAAAPGARSGADEQDPLRSGRLPRRSARSRAGAAAPSPRRLAARRRRARWPRRWPPPTPTTRRCRPNGRSCASTDENVPQALAGWRPTVVLAGTAGYGDGVHAVTTPVALGRFRQRADGPRSSAPPRRRVTQPIYTRRQDAGEPQPRRKPGHGRARRPDRPGTDQLHRHGQRLCRRDPGAAAAGAEHQQRAGADASSCRRPTTASASARSPAPTWRRPRRRWPARRRSGRPRKAISQTARATYPAGGRLPAAGRPGRAAAAELPVRRPSRRPSRSPPPTTRT